MGSTLDEKAVRHVAHLARLTITDDEAARYAGQLSTVLTYMAKLNELDTSDVPPTAHALPISNVFRTAETPTTLPPDQALHNAPSQQDGFFRVPKVLDQGEA